MTRLTRLTLRGYKSIKEETLVFQDRNVLIGANGAGKSNLLSFFQMLSWMLPSPPALQLYVSKRGASAMLFDGPAVTPFLDAEITFEAEKGTNAYGFKLTHAAGDVFVFVDERFRFLPKGTVGTHNWTQLGVGHQESKLVERAEKGESTPSAIRSMLRQCVLYQFHNTSENARIRQYWPQEDDVFLKEDAANLAPFLMRMRDEKRPFYERIEKTLRLFLPYFGEFLLEARDGSKTVPLRWRESGSDLVFGPQSASDGTLRVMALVTLLLQPKPPAVIILDEPELGLHPYAINVVAGLIKGASVNSQVILATQSPMLLSHFDPEDVVVVERPGRNTTFRRLESEVLLEWLEEYSLGELWEKNVFGGRPA